MRHILLFRTVRTEFLNFCAAACRRRFPDQPLVLVAQSDAPGQLCVSGVDEVVSVPPGMLLPAKMPDGTVGELEALQPSAAVIPVYNPRLGFYRDAYRVALRTGAKRVLALGLDGRFFELKRSRFIVHRLLDWKGSRLLASFFLAPYILWLLLRASVATAGAGGRCAGRKG